MEKSKKNEGSTMVISEEIIADAIRNMEKHYKELAELFAKKTLPECKQIKETMDSLKQMRYGKKYPDLSSTYSWLGGYCGKTIYIFSVTNFPYSISDIEKKFDEISKKPSNEKFLLPRRNENSPEWENIQKNKEVCLYVGSSEDIRQRLKEHLFLCNPKAYAMHLEAWFNPEITITINTWGFDSFLIEGKSDFLQNIEDILWDHYKPLFGKQGKK